MYRDSKLGLCIDLLGPDGNVFALIGVGNDLARQMNQKEEWKQAVQAVRLMDGNYLTMVNMFKQFFPVITLIGYKEIQDANAVEDT